MWAPYLSTCPDTTEHLGHKENVFVSLVVDITDVYFCSYKHMLVSDMSVVLYFIIAIDNSIICINNEIRIEKKTGYIMVLKWYRLKVWLTEPLVTCMHVQSIHIFIFLSKGHSFNQSINHVINYEIYSPCLQQYLRSLKGHHPKHDWFPLSSVLQLLPHFLQYISNWHVFGLHPFHFSFNCSKVQDTPPPFPVHLDTWPYHCNTQLLSFHEPLYPSDVTAC